ncbi:MAG: beta-propeller fold lactonase family protein [Chitinispirillaceae bacterium]|nr:beta-propeller fold lactonase family protein [Chitinispirillaceae bacterium]
MDKIIAFILLITAVQTYSNQLEYLGRIPDDSATVNGLAGAQSVLVSNDDRHIYVAGLNDHSICWFTRLSKDDIEYSGRVKNDSNNVSGLECVYDITFSKDERFVYAVTYYSNTLVWFSINKNTGLLTFEGKLFQGTNHVKGLNIPIKIALSPCGKHLYTVSYNDSTIGLFALDSASGLPSYQNFYKDGTSAIDGLAGGYDICLVPAGNNAYVVAKKDSSLSVFNRSTTTGELTFIEKYVWSALPCSTLIYPTKLISSSDGKYIYVASAARGSISWFLRNKTTGKLSLQGEIIDNQNGFSGLSDVNDIAVIDHGYKFVATGYGGVTILNLNEDNGSLSFDETCRVAASNGIAFFGTSVAFTSDYKYIFVADFGDRLQIFSYSNALVNYNNVKNNITLNMNKRTAFYDLRGRIIVSDPITKNISCNLIISKGKKSNSKYFAGVLTVK